MVLFHAFATQSAVPGLTSARVGGLIAAFIFILCPVIYIVTKQRFLASLLLLITAYAIVVFSCLKNGGAPAPTLPFLINLPLVATLLLNRKAGLAFVGVTAVALIFLLFASDSGLATPSPHTEGELRFLFASGVFVSALAVAMLAFSYENLALSTLEQLKITNQELTKKAAALQESRDFLSKVLESVDEGIVAANLQGRLTVVNRAAREFHGLGIKAVESDEWSETYDLYEADAKTPLALERVPLYRALKGETLVEQEMVIAPKHLPTRSLIARAAPLLDAEGDQVGAVAIMHDVTSERKQALEISRQNEELQHFARVASHDLQEPLRKLSVFCDFLRQDLGDDIPERAKTDIDAITDSAARMLQLVKDLLRLSRIKDETLLLQSVAPENCIRAAIRAIDLNAGEAPPVFEFDELPMVMADETLLTQVYQNLISNALKFSQLGKALQIVFTAEERKGEVVLGVCDNGIGVASEHSEKIFEPLTRLHRREEYDGSGIGLAICKRALARLGGCIWVEESAGGGAHFRIALESARGKQAA